MTQHIITTNSDRSSIATRRSRTSNRSRCQKTVNRTRSFPGSSETLSAADLLSLPVMDKGSRMDCSTVPAASSFEERQLERVQRREQTIAQASAAVAARRAAS